MSEFEPKGSFEDNVELSSLDNIQADGISIRVGGQIINFVAADVQDVLVKDEVMLEFTQKYDDEVVKLHQQVDELKNSLKEQVLKKNRELDDREQKLEIQLRESKTLPTITETQMRQGLTVSTRRGRGYIWSYICIYAPKYVSEALIDPAFAKRLMTPIRIFIYTDENWKTTDVRLVKLINCDKFDHYHSMSDERDCWGDMKVSGFLMDDAEKALTFIRSIQSSLETINRFSIAQRAPKGMSRLVTVEKNLINNPSDKKEDKGSSTSASRRNDRTGFDADVNNTEEVWST